MKLRQLQQFVTLAEVGNFRRAAQHLHMAQPALSVSIRNLEHELGVPLFERHSSGARLTTAGRAMLSQARQTLFHAAQCRQHIDDAQQGVSGVLRIGFIGSASYTMLPRLIPSLRQHFPKVELELNEATSSGVLEYVTERKLDLGLLRYPVLDAVDCEILPLDQDEFVLAVAEHSPLAQRGPAIALSEAASQPFIMYPRTRVPSLSAMAMLRCQASGFVPRIAQEAMQVQTIMSLVASGLGVGLIAGIARHHLMPGVRCLQLSDTPKGLHIGIALASPKDRRSQMLDNVLQHTRDLLRSSHCTDSVQE